MVCRIFLVTTCRIFSCGIWDLVPWPEIEPNYPPPRPPHWECEVLATGPPGKSLDLSAVDVVFNGGGFGSFIRMSPLCSPDQNEHRVLFCHPAQEHGAAWSERHFLSTPRGEHLPRARHWAKGLTRIMSFKPFYRWGNWGQESVNGSHSFLETHPWSSCKVWPSSPGWHRSPCDTYSAGTMADIIQCPMLFSYFFRNLTVILWNTPVLLFPEEEADTQG